jgi:hypothetical protein
MTGSVREKELDDVEQKRSRIICSSAWYKR